MLTYITSAMTIIQFKSCQRRLKHSQTLHIWLLKVSMFVNRTRVYYGRCMMTVKITKNWITNRNTVQHHSTC